LSSLSYLRFCHLKKNTVVPPLTFLKLSTRSKALFNSMG